VLGPLALSVDPRLLFRNNTDVSTGRWRDVLTLERLRNPSRGERQHSSGRANPNRRPPFCRSEVLGMGVLRSRKYARSSSYWLRYRCCFARCVVRGRSVVPLGWVLCCRCWLNCDQAGLMAEM
jgi:hypothetical protein